MSKYAIETCRLSKVYGDQAVVRDLSIHVPRGSIYGFLGPNGAGKSTTMKMLLGLVKPSSGQIVEFRNSASNGSSKKVLPGLLVGSLIEGPAFYPNLSALENVDLVCDYLGIVRAQGREALDMVGLSGITGKKPVKAFSLGMKQRLGIALALAANPPVLILDEPTNGLDPAGVVEMRKLIVNWAHNRGTTVMISSHILSEIEQMADYVGIISAGTLRFEGRMQDICSAGYLQLQVSDMQSAVVLLSNCGIDYKVEEASRSLILPIISNEVVANLVAHLVNQNVKVYRVQMVRQSLEEAFLELTDPIYTSKVVAK